MATSCPRRTETNQKRPVSSGPGSATTRHSWPIGTHGNATASCHSVTQATSSASKFRHSSRPMRTLVNPREVELPRSLTDTRYFAGVKPYLFADRANRQEGKRALR